LLQCNKEHEGITGSLWNKSLWQPSGDTKQNWDDRGQAACGEFLRQLNETLERARQPETAETQLRILESSRDKLVSMASTMQAEAEDKTGEELNEVNNKVMRCRKCIEDVSPMLMICF
jgi:hypothetical protein